MPSEHESAMYVWTVYQRQDSLHLSQSVIVISIQV